MLEKLRKDVKAMDESFVGQHELKRALVSTMHIHMDLARKRTPNMLICGPSGSGKTAMATWIAEYRDCPVITVPITTYSQIGYKGTDVTEIWSQMTAKTLELLKSWLDECIPVFKKFVKGIVDPNTPLPAVRSILRYSSNAIHTVNHNLLEHPTLVPFKNIELDMKVFQYDWHERSDEDKAAFATAVRKLAKDDKAEYRVEYLCLVCAIGNYVAYADTLVTHLELTLRCIMEQSIVIIDEIDKITVDDGDNDNVGRAGVQRDLLQIVGGSVIGITVPAKDLAFINDYLTEIYKFTKPTAAKVTKTKGGKKTVITTVTEEVPDTSKAKYRVPASSGTLIDIPTRFSLFGDMSAMSSKKEYTINVNTACVWFIGCGAFMLSKLDGLIDELRGRFSIITKTTALTREEIMHLTTTQTLAEVNHDIRSLGVTVAFGEGGLDAFTTAVFALNVREPLGARRLPGFMFQIVTDEIMDVEGTELLITPELVDRAMQRVERANDTRVIGFK